MNVAIEIVNETSVAEQVASTSTTTCTCIQALLLLLALLGALLAFALALAAVVFVAARELLARLAHRRVALVPALHAPNIK